MEKRNKLFYSILFYSIQNDLSVPKKLSFLTAFLKFSAVALCSELFSLL
jgi:hypothetical protein